jgi:hypothetical protein
MEWKDAGIDRMKMFKHFNVIDDLCSSPLEYDAMSRVRVGSIYARLLRDKVKDEINRKFHENRQ